MVADSGQGDRLSAATGWEKGFITGCSLEKIADARYIVIMSARRTNLCSPDGILTDDAVLSSQAEFTVDELSRFLQNKIKGGGTYAGRVPEVVVVEDDVKLEVFPNQETNMLLHDSLLLRPCIRD
jgi:hypothetical protein